jgi:hypothetical protein
LDRLERVERLSRLEHLKRPQLSEGAGTDAGDAVGGESGGVDALPEQM